MFHCCANDGPTWNAGLLALWFCRGSRPVSQRNPIFFFLQIFQGEGLDPLSPPCSPPPPPSGSAHCIRKIFFIFFWRIRSSERPDYLLAYWVNLSCFIVICWIFFRNQLFQKILSGIGYHQSVKQLGSRSGPDLDPNCLQRLSADDTSRQSIRFFSDASNCLKNGASLDFFVFLFVLLLHLPVKVYIAMLGCFLGWNHTSKQWR